MPYASERIFVYDNNTAHLSAFQDFFDSRSLKMFGTDNIYNLLRYTQEITPEIMIFNLNDDAQFAQSSFYDLMANIHTKAPLIVLNPHNITFMPDNSIAHYLPAPINAQKLTDIIESYCIGHKRHKIMLLESASATSSPLSRQFEEQHYNYFQVHNCDAANQYLCKNFPQTICIEYNLSFILERHLIEHNRIIYVDRQQDIAEIEKFLN